MGTRWQTRHVNFADADPRITKGHHTAERESRWSLFRSRKGDLPDPAFKLVSNLFPHNLPRVHEQIFLSTEKAN